MSAEADFLAWVRREPQSDTPRLAYADWLEENGKTASAEFIRRHIEWIDCEDREVGSLVELMLDATGWVRDGKFCLSLRADETCNRPLHLIPERGLLTLAVGTLDAILGAAKEVWACPLACVLKTQVTDKKPLQEGRFSWYIERTPLPHPFNTDDPAHRLPRGVFARLKLGDFTPRDEAGGRRSYRTREIALADMEHAVLEEARALAGVPI